MLRIAGKIFVRRVFVRRVFVTGLQVEEEFDAWCEQSRALRTATHTSLTIPLMLKLAVIYDAHVSGARLSHFFESVYLVKLGIFPRKFSVTFRIRISRDARVRFQLPKSEQ
jgi:hypothetical protein